jgi:hypothetical protein
METPLKFKIWNNKIKQWMTTIDGVSFIYVSGSFIPICDPDIEILLSTGIRDNNDREIYIGDILKIRCQKDWQTNHYVVHNIKDFYNTLSIDDKYLRVVEFEIVGNIYQ